MYFKLQKMEFENEMNYEKSKIGGSPVFPIGFFTENNLEEDMFIAQVNLNEIKCEGLPQEGYLYFFLNVDKYPYQPKVFYTKEQVREVYEDINEGFEDYGRIDAYEIIPTTEDYGHSLATLPNPELDIDCMVDTTDLIVLLELDSLELPTNVLNLGTPDGWYLFVIQKNDLENLDFSKVEFVSYGS